MIGIGNYVSDGLGATTGGVFARLFGFGTLAPMAALGPGLLPLAPFLMGHSYQAQKRRCAVLHPFNHAKRQECMLTWSAKQKCKVTGGTWTAAGCSAGGGGGGGAGAVIHGTSAGPMTVLPGGVAPADMSPDTAEERASKAAAAGGGGVTGIIGMIPWWGWVAAAGVGGYLLLRRRSAA